MSIKYDYAAIAKKLNINPALILWFTELADVVVVRFIGGCRFVSKKIALVKQPVAKFYKWTADGGVNCQAVLSGEYYEISVEKIKKVIGEQSIATWVFNTKVAAAEFVAAMEKANLC
jgi:hypothetical protein